MDLSCFYNLMSKAQIKHEGSKTVIFCERSSAYNLGKEMQSPREDYTMQYPEE